MIGPQDLLKLRLEHFNQFSTGEKGLARRVIWETYVELNEIRREHLVKYAIKNAVNQEYVKARTIQKLEEISDWLYSDSYERGSLLFWASFFSDCPEVIQQNMIAICGLKPVTKYIKLPPRRHLNELKRAA